ncbi:MAG: hypothetical protein AAGE65_01530 [Planctomycetota bacterium]
MSRPLFRAFSLAAIAVTAALAAPGFSEADTYTTSDEDFVVSTTEKKELTLDTGYLAPVWTSDQFKGEHFRGLDHDRLVIRIDQTAGGYDTAVARHAAGFTRVDEVHPDTYVEGEFEVTDPGTGDGFWVYGPKVSVNWDGFHLNEPDGWYENYIVDTASLSPGEIEQWLYDVHKAKPIGTTRHNGSVYKHYRLVHKRWVQLWAVRQDYRNGGVTHLYPILRHWRRHGLPNEKFDGVKLNMEFFGENRRAFEIRDYFVPAHLDQRPSQQ